MARGETHQYHLFVPEVERELGSRPTTRSLVGDLDLQVYLSSNSRATAETIQAHEGFGAYAQRISDRKYSRLVIPAHEAGTRCRQTSSLTPLFCPGERSNSLGPIFDHCTMLLAAEMDRTFRAAKYDPRI